MARYAHDFRGTYGGPTPPRGLDPNYRGGYRGMRTEAEGGQAPYGRYRETHAYDLGFSRGAPVGYRGGVYDRQYRRAPTRFEPGRGGGGVHDPRYDDAYLRDFNAHSPGGRGGRGGYDREWRGGARPAYDRPFRPGYASRGLSSSGYSQPWAHGPMRGSRP